ncbi:bifunctional diguanylate cyclase/phosphodiesterase [Duganella sp. HH101]|uniref:putative bifunctional diguanylate cyclase/phosphodiesterase n=1 Tax=Duganella sp. HH101 TaxID=1781066 RepID=UPI0008737CDE|nr:bifunctional diguanylate cyclase/phosphodiesterase [Duganella sp. HH101]OFA03587.1 phytochrome-like protein cph2 [Duganella sp. HH101]
MSSDAEAAYEALIQFLYRAPVALIQLQSDGAIEMLNPMAAQLLMPLAPQGDLLNLFTVLAPYADDLPRLCGSFAASHGVICEGRRLLVTAARPQAGAPAVLSLGLLKVDDGRLMAVLADVTQEVAREQRQLASRLASAARVDVLTQLPNRAGALGMLQRMVQRPRRAEDAAGALLFINLDRFKQINDSHGNEAGDRVMVLVAERLRSTLRASDRAPGRHGASELAARVGGDEFAVLLDGLPGPDIAERIAARLLDRLSKPYQLGAQELACSFSMGIVLLGADADGAEADDLLRDAATAMAVAKAGGGDRYAVFAPAMREQAALRGGLEADLRHAVERGELFNVYQPVVGLQADGQVDRAAGVEALVRWRHPVRGLVGPVEFIGVAEECGLISAIGEQVLAAACADFVGWQRQLGARAPRLLAVNLSRAQLAQPGLCGRVGAILRATGMPAERLQLEITESLAAQGQDIQQQLLEFKAMGIKLALDDFGTGYSSLSSLHLLPVDTVKIDRSFVSAADTSRHHEVLIEATVKVARSLGMSTVAEGIETVQQAAVVRRQGCDKGQGYLYSRPLAAEALMAWLMAEHSL